jgi:hypothetical protein
LSGTTFQSWPRESRAWRRVALMRPPAKVHQRSAGVVVVDAAARGVDGLAHGGAVLVEEGAGGGVEVGIGGVAEEDGEDALAELEA